MNKCKLNEVGIGSKKSFGVMGGGANSCQPRNQEYYLKDVSSFGHYRFVRILKWKSAPEL